MRSFMNEFKNKPEPKKIKMPPLVDRSRLYDTLSWDNEPLTTDSSDEDYSKNNSESIPKLDSL